MRSHRFGVEEEYLLLEGTSGAPANRADDVIRAAPGLQELATREFYLSQLETATPVCQDATDAEASLTRFRMGMSRVAGEMGLVLAGTGLPPVGGDIAGEITPEPRYGAIGAHMGHAAEHQYGTGTHVHVELPSRDAGVEVLCRLARWAPTLVALTANSPLWCGKPTGFASWRYVAGLTWPLSGFPPDFVDGAHYTQSLERLVESNVLLDQGMVTWVARLSENYPTIELRIADAQLEASDAVAFALIVRALVAQCLDDCERGRDRPRILPAMVNGAIWLAARDGLAAELIDPYLGQAQPAFVVVEQMLNAAAPWLSAAGDDSQVERYLDRRRREGSPASEQLRQFDARGVPGLLDLYRSGSEQRPAAAGESFATRARGGF